ncbi:MAG: 5-(carboxyamino)imidazole ribonucleotide synthase [Hyphomicrobiales bacterium]
MLKPGQMIGILGGGQLARMMALAAAPLGLKCHIYAPEGDNPAFDVAAAKTIAPYEDHAALERFARTVDVVTYEFENVPAKTAEILSSLVEVLPQPRALETTQDRLIEKSFIRDLGLAVPDFIAVDSPESLSNAVQQLGRPSVLKTRRFGYDGKGQVIIKSETNLDEAWAGIGRAPAILEQFIPFEREVSVIAARNASGDVVTYDVCENRHAHHILAETTLPARISAETEQAAKDAASRIGAALNYVGVFAVEFFVGVLGAQEFLLVNEIAPRVHNSGHWTIDGAETSQFEHHIRAISGWPLGSVKRLGRIEMRNLIGGDSESWHDRASEPGLHVHLYGKAESRPGRKMGHVTRVTI